ncbi:MAG: DUF4426 domain-containing protein [Gammaproteobacteria bacterium]|nr:DUF4426 domain-containing protein [Gammaproteobacteria bacterium]MCF6260617.1 DUF4426 domain-containing protein [Gammaproteobacteria bacterium]
MDKNKTYQNHFFKNLYITGIFLLMCGLSQAGEPQVFGDYTVHYNAFNTDTLQPKMAATYNIVRSKNRGMVNISVLKKTDSGNKPVRADITISASNLTGQLRTLKVREVNKNNAIYYLSEFHVAHEEMLNFTLKILPEGSSQSMTVNFRQKFFTQ